MGIAVLYGGYSVFLSAEKEGKTEANNDIQALNQFIVNIAGNIGKGTSDESAYILRKAVTQWKQDPFWVEEIEKTPVLIEEKKPMERQDFSFRYNGYLKTGNTMLALINGMEYEVGDSIDNKEIVVDAITAERVTLKTASGGQIVLLLDEKL